MPLNSFKTSNAVGRGPSVPLPGFSSIGVNELSGGDAHKAWRENAKRSRGNSSKTKQDHNTHISKKRV